MSGLRSLALALCLALPASELAAEEIPCDWRLEGLQGLLARVLPFVPASGEALLSVVPAAETHVDLQFRATSASAPDGEHWTYGARFDPRERRTLRVVESSRFRGRDKRREHDLRDQRVVDLLSGLHLIRLDLPERREDGMLWANRRFYPVSLEPSGIESRKIQGVRRNLLRFVVSGRRLAEHRFWEESAEVWLTEEAPNLPVEMLFRQRFGRVRLICDAPAD